MNYKDITIDGIVVRLIRIADNLGFYFEYQGKNYGNFTTTTDVLDDIAIKEFFEILTLSARYMIEELQKSPLPI